ncbi:FAD-binding protein [Alloiococcus sp. CFN-8]|uniref:FAD-binding protein n=1 Tax=Alloiococcus sp. CFN-8 TaxID=3416081 RepID=UPI003CEFFA40
MRYMYDIAIIGLGPAGAMAARLLDKEFKVIALDKKDPMDNASFMKPCGGLLAPDAQKALARFELNLPKSVLVDPQIFSVRTIDLDTGDSCNYQRLYLNLNRHSFDLWLQSLIPENVEVHNNSQCSEIKSNGDNFEIKYLEDGVVKEAEAKYVIAADGAASMVRRSFYPNKKIRSYVSIQQWFTEKHSNPFYSCIFDSKNTDCYSWSISKDGFFIFGGAYPSKDSREHFERQKELLKEKGFEFGEPIKTEACVVLRPSSLRDFTLGKDGLFFIGEAAGFISPSSLEGISSAINSAFYAAKALNSHGENPNKLYNTLTFKLRLKITLKLLKCPFMYNPFLRKLVMKSRLTTIDVIDS